jgi:GNT-I family
MPEIKNLNFSTAILLVGYKRLDFLINRISELEKNFRLPIIISIDGNSDSETANVIKLYLTSYVENNPESALTFKIQGVNLGIAKHIPVAISGVLSEYNQVIVVEDDVVISKNFVKAMLSGFELARNQADVGVIGGFSLYKDSLTFSRSALWRKSKYFSAWGWGINRENWEKFRLVLPNNFQDSLEQSNTWNSLSSYRKNMHLSRFKKVTNDNQPLWEYQMQYFLFRYDLKMLLTTRRISDNEGFGSYLSTNTIGARPRWMGDIKLSETAVISRISKTSWLYEIGDAITVGGDSRILYRLGKIRRTFSNLPAL